MTRAKRNLEGEVDVDGEPFVWRLHREPQWSAGGWQGMALAIRHKEGQREAILLFPMTHRPNGSPQLERPSVPVEIVLNGVAGAIAAGWKPMSRGKPVTFDVDAEGR